MSQRTRPRDAFAQVERVAKEDESLQHHYGINGKAFERKCKCCRGLSLQSLAPPHLSIYFKKRDTAAYWTLSCSMHKCCLAVLPAAEKKKEQPCRLCRWICRVYGCSLPHRCNENLKCCEMYTHRHSQRALELL